MEENRRKEILELLQTNARYTPQQIAVMLNMEPADVEQAIREMEEEGLIIGYHALVNWNKISSENVIALIEVKVSPQRDVGFDAVAERIARFPEVRTMRLMSGTYDLAVEVHGRTMQDVAFFVATRLATIEGVVSTTTHFVLKSYKEHGILLGNKEEGAARLVVSP
ncbi:Lrp/AsnC family transcriptional regulator [Thermodesulfitimonas autotrophica]|uniref:Lrp/AsnC family transcriptional regulator n=1 Tax=Thermodesulfitimonas autotrophica TaxID=1894989 RepID=UPI002FE35FE0